MHTMSSMEKHEDLHIIDLMYTLNIMNDMVLMYETRTLVAMLIMSAMKTMPTMKTYVDDEYYE